VGCETIYAFIYRTAQQAAKSGCCDACKRGAVAKPAADYGRVPRLTTAYRSFGCGANTGTHRDTPWPVLLDYWGLPNIQVINRDAKFAKCVAKARDRRTLRYLAPGKFLGMIRWRGLEA
jgi:hypothetical protein